MVTLEKLRIDLEKKLAQDKEIQAIEVRGDTLDDCLQDASVQLDAKVKNLEYEVLEKGSSGILGLMKKPWLISVYENPEVVKQKKQKVAENQAIDDDAVLEVENIDKNGMFRVRRFGAHLYLKVTLPVGEGVPVEEKDVLNAVRRPDNTYLDENEVFKAIREGTNDEYVEIGAYNHIGAGDALLAVNVAKDEMSATITVSPPQEGGSEISEDQIFNFLKIQGVVAGFNEDKIREFVDNPVYDVAVEVASAVLPVHGSDAYIEYKFETDRTKLKLKETESGQVDFKELNLIQNVVAGQPLAQKFLPTRGKGGKTILGHYLEARNGRDVPLPLGNNTILDKDGRTILAEKSGHVMLLGDKITVEEVYEVQGVNIKTGNITFMGTVICRGNVDDGFSIKASGNVEIYGSVGNCNIEADGDIVISQGVMGRDEGQIKSGKSVWVRFLQNVKVQAEEYVVANDNIMNSNVTAMKKILVKGKRASIIGGHLFATEEITAKNIGSSGGGIETIIEVGFDPKAKQRLLELSEMQTNLLKELEEVDLNIASLENIKKVRKMLPKEKEDSLKNFKIQRAELADTGETYQNEINEIQDRLRELKVVGRVNASGTVYSGSKIMVRDEVDEVRSECKGVSFYYEDGFVKRGKYDPSQVTEDVGVPDGYTTN